MNYAPLSAFLLAGGASSRMGRDKALIEFEGKPLLVRLATMLRSLAGDVTILAPAGRYESFGYKVLPDRRANCGPLSGIETALRHSGHPWVLILACDLAHVTPEWLATVASHARPGLDVITSGDNPLCALWNISALPAVSAALDSGQFRVRSLVASLKSENLIPPDPGILANWNRPEDLPPFFGERKANRGG
jgi:molybdopterin-guanine dinucleotide biosynthesis protein A